VADYAADIDAVRAHFGWDRFFLAGHSMGARASIYYASRFPHRVKRLAALDFLTSISVKSHEKYERKMKRRQPTYSSKDRMIENFHLQPRGTLLSADELRKIAEMSVRTLDNGRFTWKFDWRAFFFEYSPIWEDTPAIDAPSLILRGEHSTVMSQEDFKKVLGALKNGTGTVLPGTYHHISLDAPEAVAAALCDFGD